MLIVVVVFIGTQISDWLRMLAHINWVPHALHGVQTVFPMAGQPSSRAQEHRRRTDWSGGSSNMQNKGLGTYHRKGANKTRVPQTRAKLMRRASCKGKKAGPCFLALAYAPWPFQCQRAKRQTKPSNLNRQDRWWPSYIGSDACCLT